jgi:anthranilate phosphoribosyltransferase
MTELLEKIIQQEHLNFDEAYKLAKDILNGELQPEQISSFLTALRSKGESTDEILGFVTALQENMVEVNYPDNENLLDVCGTGGDRSHTFNISTATAFVVAAAGYKVAKHGNRSVSSKSGSSDVLTHFGVNLNIPAQEIPKILDEIGIVFLFAPNFHPILKNVADIRKKLGVRTIFNILGPLLNPLRPQYQMIGTINNNMVQKIASVAQKMHYKKIYSVCEDNSKDEILLNGNIYVNILINNTIYDGNLTEKDFNLSKSNLKNLLANSVEESGKLILSILRDKQESDAYNVVLANSALAIKAIEDKKTLYECKDIANEAIQSGRAYEKLSKYIELSKKYK